MRVERARDIGADQRFVGLAEERACRRVARTLQEHALAVDRQRRSVPLHFAKRRDFREAVAQGAIDLHVDVQAAQQLRAETARPPARRVVDGQGPRELVGTCRERDGSPRVEQHVAGGSAYDRVQASATELAGRVECHVAPEPAALHGSVDAQHACAIDAHRSR